MDAKIVPRFTKEKQRWGILRGRTGSFVEDIKYLEVLNSHMSAFNMKKYRVLGPL